MIGLIMTVALMIPAPLPVPAAEPPPHERIMAVPAELQARVQKEVVANTPWANQRMQRLVEFMFAPDGLGMTYRDDATYTVEEAYATREANCLTFTLLFVALAREARLDAYPQEIEETLAWHQLDNTIYRTNHVNAGVRVSGRRFTVDVAADTVIARHHPEPVSDKRLLALYYNNQAVALMAENRIAPALAYMASAMDLEPEYASLWSNAGVLFLRNGDAAAAERAYEKALTLAPDHGGALFNMVALSKRNGDQRREEEFRRRLESLREKDPFHQFLLAIEYEKSGDYAHAVQYYQRAIRLYPEEHRFYSGLASAYMALGDVRRANRALVRAQAHSEGATRDLYQAVLKDLKKMQERPRIAQ